MDFALNLLGGFELKRGSGETIRLPTRKAEALLAYLALARNQGVGRDVLSGLLWGDAAEADARASLRQTLSLIGKALGRGAMAPEGRTIALLPDAVRVDVFEFDRHAAAADPADLARAAELYRGELLSGLGITGTAFEEWLLAERERRRETAIDIFARLVAVHSQDGEANLAIDYALRLLAIDPLEEIAHRALMRLYAEQGRRAAALRQYQVCVRVLRQELGTDPAAETRALYNDLLVNRQPEAPSPITDLPIHATPLVGRDPEFARIASLLDGARASQGRIVAILGETGIGKTRLTEELAGAAVTAGMRVLSGRCYESQQLFPFAPWIELLRAAGVPGDRTLLAELEPIWRVALSRLFPEIAPDQAEAAGEASGYTDQHHMVEAVMHAVARIAARTPLLLVLEDLHWADEMSLRLLAIASRRVRTAPVLIAVTAREEEVPGTPGLSRSLQELAKSDAFSEVRLTPISRDETAELVKALSRPGSDKQSLAGVAEKVWRASEGNPFVIFECMRAVSESGARAAEGDIALPSRVRDLIKEHVDRLGPEARKLLATAAIAGREFDFALLRRTSGLSERSASDALEELVRRQLLHAVGEHFDFVHDRIRQAVHDNILAPVRRSLHLALGQALEELHRHDLARVYDRLAHHFSRSDRSDKAIEYLTRFAERAARAGAHGPAISALDDALARLEKNPGPSQARQRFDLIFRKTRSLLLLGRLKEVIELLLPEQATVDAAADPRMAGAYHHRLAATFNYLGDRNGTERHGRLALSEAAACEDFATMGKAHVTLANHQFWQRPEEGMRHGQQAVALLEKCDERWWLGQAYWILGLNLSYRGRFAEALESEKQANALGEAVGDRRLACTAAWATGFIHTLAGDWDAAVASCRKGVELAPDPLSRMTSAGMLALAHVERQEPREAIALLDEMIPLAEKFRFAPLHGLYLGFRGEAALQAGDAGNARTLAEQGVALTRSSGYIYGLGWTQRIQARIEKSAGNLPLACTRMREAIGTFSDMGAPFETARGQQELGEMLASMGDTAGARVCAEAALAELEALGLEKFAARSRALLAQLVRPDASAVRAGG
jgi:DNA-binding SARP family transcriptional activator